MSAEYIREIRRMETIRLPDYYQHFGSIEADDDYGRFSKRPSIFRLMTARETMGYNLASKEFYEVRDGLRESPGTCFMENLKLLRQRNNKKDRLISACLSRRGEDGEIGTISHCFIVNGRNIIDHSNFRKKTYCMDVYLHANTIVRYMECDNPHDIEDEDIVKAAWKKCLEMGDRVSRLSVNGFIFKNYNTPFVYKKGDWDEAVKRVL